MRAENSLNSSKPLYPWGNLKNSASKTILSAIVVTGSLSFANQSGAAVIFRDTFARSGETDNTDLNSSGSGKSGTEASSDWVEVKNFRSAGIGLGTGDAVIPSSPTSTLELRKVSGSSDGNNGSMIFIDHNFVGLSSFRVDMRLLGGSSAGDGRGFGFSIGQSRDDLINQDSASPSQAPGDFSIFYDSIGGTQGISTRHNGSFEANLQNTAPYPRTLSAVFTFANMNLGTVLNYEVLLDNNPIGSGSTAWSGTDENYISLQSNYTNFARINFFEVSGEFAPVVVIPEPSVAILSSLGLLALMRRRR